MTAAIGVSFKLTSIVMISEYTVKVLSKRPKPQPIDQDLVDFRNQHFARAEIPRRDGEFHSNYIMAGWRVYSGH